MRIWITGICGFLGSHLCEALLAAGHEVDGNDSLICGDEKNLPKLPHGYALTDCRNFDAMLANFKQFQPEVVVHCAATAHEGLSSFSPSFITRNIYEASVATFSAAISAGVKRIVYMSSMARYGRQMPPFTEDLPCKPVDPYGIAKIAAEETLRILCNTHGVKWAIAVPHNIIGIRQRSIDPYRNVAAIMINRCKQGKMPIIYGDGQQRRCFSPIKDCLPSLLKMIDGAADSEVVNIGPDKGEITIKELADRIISLTDCKYPIMYMTGRTNEVKLAYTCSEKARNLLGYKEQQSLDSCLLEMVDYIKPQPFVYDFPLEIVTDKIPVTWKDRIM